jgi:hypothetical protein
VFSDGLVGDLDFAGALPGVLAIIDDDDVFPTVTIDPVARTVAWPEGVDVDPRLADAGAVASIGTVGDSYDNALAESTIGLYKTEYIHFEGPWAGVDDVELATLNWVWWLPGVQYGFDSAKHCRRGRDGPIFVGGQPGCGCASRLGKLGLREASSRSALSQH